MNEPGASLLRARSIRAAAFGRARFFQADLYQKTTSRARTAMGVKGGRLATLLKSWS
jgi:hypothetical protein